MGINIDEVTHKTEKFYKNITNKKLIIIGDTCRFGLNHIKRLTNQPYETIGKYPTYTIDKSGKIFQHFNPEYYSSILGNVDFDKMSITILLENMNWLYYDNYTDSYYNWVNEKCENVENIIEKEFRGYRYWDSYTTQQYKSLIKLCKFLQEKFDIENNIVSNCFIYNDINNYTGIISRANIEIYSKDVNPSFDYKKFLKGMGIS
jgi:N-acetyl-anhydromuramyl-L-alanine amidase AmpD